ncbi:hypothetical protein D3C75_1246250 [compost metagenome]
MEVSFTWVIMSRRFRVMSLKSRASVPISSLLLKSSGSWVRSPLAIVFTEADSLVSGLTIRRIIR